MINTNSINNKIPWISSFKEISNKYDYFVFDCDGVIWKEDYIFKNAVEEVKKLQEEGKKVFFLSNTNRWSRNDLVDKFKNCGLDVSQTNVYTSSFLISKYISENYSQIQHIYLIGGAGLESELQQKGFVIYGGSENKNVPIMDGFVSKDIEDLEVDDKIQACLCGYDEKFDYFKIVYGGQVILKTGKFFGTNYDRRTKIGDKISPGSYTFIAALEAFTEIKAEIITKPDPRSLNIILSDHGLDLNQVKDKVLMIGDNCKTDIQFANNNGIDSLLMLTGITNQEDLEGIFIEGGDNRPTYVLKNF